MEIETSAVVRDALMRYIELRDGLAALMRPRKFWEKSIPIEAQVTLMEEVGRAKATLTTAILREHPELRAGGWTVSETYITPHAEADAPAQTPEP